MDEYYDGFNSCNENGNEEQETKRDQPSSRSRPNVIEDFCNSLKRGDLTEAEGLLAFTPYRSLSLGARLGCGLIDLAKASEN
ncbi:MAG: hypothetical protein WBL68_06400 [Nitrososphaeraceae archaeon]